LDEKVYKRAVALGIPLHAGVDDFVEMLRVYQRRLQSDDAGEKTVVCFHIKVRDVISALAVAV
jgi:hypothetical protein